MQKGNLVMMIKNSIKFEITAIIRGNMEVLNI